MLKVSCVGSFGRFESSFPLILIPDEIPSIFALSPDQFPIQSDAFLISPLECKLLGHLLSIAVLNVIDELPLKLGSVSDVFAVPIGQPIEDLPLIVIPVGLYIPPESHGESFPIIPIKDTPIRIKSSSFSIRLVILNWLICTCHSPI